MGSGLELSGRRRDGTSVPVEISLSPVGGPASGLTAAAIRDVSDRRRVEAEARRANSYLASAVDSIQDAFALYDEADRVVLVNSAFRSLLGGSIGGAIVGRGFAELVDDVLGAGLLDLGAEPAAALRARWLAYRETPTGALELSTRAGRTLRVIDRRTAEGGTVSLLLDVTEDRVRADELRRAREEAEAASAAKSEFLASMSHELRTPLNAVLGFAQLLQLDRKQPLSPRQHERITYVLRGGEHLLRLIDDVLDLSRIEAGGITISSEPVAIAALLDDVITTLGPLAARSGIALALAPGSDAGAPVAVADRTRLSQILMNFGSNAIKYGRPGGHVTFRVEPGEARVRIAVVDDGIGIPAEQRAKLFEPFHRAGQETGPIEGTGIGLAISKRLAALMGGSVGLTSEVGVGSTFWVDVPAHFESGDRHLAAPAPSAGAARLGARGARHQIVYVEDNPSNIAFMRAVTDELPGVELLTAPTAEIGIELVRAHQPGLVILDINLPGMSGFEAVRHLKSWPETRRIPVIAVSAAALARDTARGHEAGFDRYLTKPIQIAELTAVLEELLLPPTA
jgi:signal transduction histidine kinase